MSCKAYNPEQNPEIITYMSYGEWENIKDEMNARRLSRLNKERRRKAVYFRKQHCTGALIFLIGLICLITGCSIDNSILQYFGGIIGIAGLYLVLTKQMVLVDNYYLERQDKINEY